MESDVPKKRKKYVKAQQKQQKIVTEAEQVYTQVSKPPSILKMKINYDFESLINFYISKLLPADDINTDLNNDLMIGEQKKLERLIAQLNDNLKYTIGMVLKLKEKHQKDDVQYQFQDQYKGKIYSSNVIRKYVQKQFIGTKFENEYQIFIRQFDDQVIFLRMQRQFADEFLQIIKDIAEVINKNEDQDSPIKPRGNRKINKVQLASAQCLALDLDIQEFKRFVRRSDKIDLTDLQITNICNTYGKLISYKIKLLCYENENKRKLQAFNYYFYFQNYLRLPLQQSKHKQGLIFKYKNYKQPNLQVKLIQGFVSSKWTEKDIMYKIRHKQISKKKTNHTNQSFQAFHIIGLFPKVNSKMSELQQQINDVPLDEIVEQIFLDFDDAIKDSIRNNKQVQKFVQNFITEYVKRYSDVCKLDKVKFPLRGVKINLLINHGKQKEFQHVQMQLQKMMVKEIGFQKREVDFMIDQELLEKLKDEGFIVVQRQQQTFKYIEMNSRIGDSSNKLQQILGQFDCLTEQVIEVKGKTRLNRYLEIVQKIKSNEKYKNILSQTISEGKVNFKLYFYGHNKKNQNFVKEVKEQIQNIQNTLGEYCEIIQQNIGKMLDEQLNFQQTLQKQFKISFIVNTNRNIEAILNFIGRSPNHLTTYLIKGTSLQKIPLNSKIIFSCKEHVLLFKQKYMESFKTKVKRSNIEKAIVDVEKSHNFQFNFLQTDSASNLIQFSFDLAKNDSKCIVFVLPKINKKKFIQCFIKKIIQNQVKCQQIYLLETDLQTDVQNLIGIAQHDDNYKKQLINTEWFCSKIPYSKSGNLKINDAISNRLKTVTLEKDDLDSSKLHSTHYCYSQKMIICPIQEIGIQIPIKMKNQRIVFNLGNQQYQFPRSQIQLFNYNKMTGLQKFKVTLPFYTIDLENMKQINIFTKFERPITKIQKNIVVNNQYTDKLKVYYNKVQSEIVYSFQQENAKNLISCVQKVQTFIKSKLIHDEIQIQEIEISQQLLERVKARADQYQIEYSVNEKKNTIQIMSYFAKDIQRFKTTLKIQINYLLMEAKSRSSIKNIFHDITFPQNWQPQTQDINIFEVQKYSKQFNQVQKKFTVRPIASLIRIQNKILYKKYQDQLRHLQYMNEGKMPKLMQLFHGTASTNPEVIYGDKDDGFNINYSSENNMLGRGVYFAQKSEYSINYRHLEDNQQNKMSYPYLRQVNRLYSMFLCQVIVGESQLRAMSHINREIKDTKYKNGNNSMRYQSMLGKHQICDIYVVYKNRRAYPHYLIKFNA